MLPYSRVFDQCTLALMMEHDAIVQRYRALFALIDWQVLPDPAPDPSRPGKCPHPESAYIKALFIKINEGYEYCSQLRTFLLEHPLLVLELGFRPVLSYDLPYGFDVQRTVRSRTLVARKTTHAGSPPFAGPLPRHRACPARRNPRPGRGRGHRCEAPICLGP